MSGFEGSPFLLFVPFLFLLLFLVSVFAVFFHYFPNPCVNGLPHSLLSVRTGGWIFDLTSAGCGFPPLGLEPTVQLCLSPPDISQSFDCLLQHHHLFLEIVHQGTPLTVQWTLPLHFLIQFCHQAEQILHFFTMQTGIISTAVWHLWQAQALRAAGDLDSCVLMCEVWVTVFLLTVAFGWVETTVSPLLVWWMTTHSLSSVPYLCELPCKLPGYTFLPCHTLCSCSLHRTLITCTSWSCLNPLWMHLTKPHPFLIGLQEPPGPPGTFWCWLGVPELRNSSVQHNSTVTPRLNLSHHCCCFCCLTDINLIKIWMVLGSPLVTWIKLKITSLWLMKTAEKWEWCCDLISAFHMGPW